MLPALPLLSPFLVRARAPPSASGFDPAAPARSYRAGFGTTRSKPLAEGAVACVRSGISGWVIGLLIRGRAGAERRAANEGKQGDWQSIALAQALRQSLIPKERLRVSNWIVQRLV